METTTKKEDRKALAKMKRQALAAKSQRANALLGGNITGAPPALVERLPDCEKVNDVLIALYQIETGQEDFRSFKRWKAEGLGVKKGEHGFPIWGQPRKFKGKRKPGPGSDPETDAEKEYKAFPLCYLFHAGQVEKRDDKARRPDPAPQRLEGDPALAGRLTELALNMESEIDSKFNPSIAQQNPTPRRNRIAQGMREEGHFLKLVQKILLAAAACHDPEAEPPAWIDQLDSPPAPSLLTVRTKKAATDYAHRHGADVRKAIEAAASPEERKREEAKAAAGKVQSAINALIGSKIPGFFPTPDALAAQVAELAELDGAKTLLEPSAGYGALIDAALAENPALNVEALEVNHTLREILELKGVRLAGSDFVEFDGENGYDRIIMNPPFENGQDVMHVTIAHSFLNPGGILVAIVCENCWYRTDKDYPEFREWLDEVGAEVVEVEAGAFKGTVAPTGVKTRIIKIRQS